MERALADHRARFRAREDRAVRDTLRAYDVTDKAIRRKQRDLLARIDEARRNGEPVTPSWLVVQERYTELLAQLQVTQDTLANTAADHLGQAQQRAVLQGAATAEKLTYIAAGGEKVARAAGIVFNRLPEQQLLAAVGVTADGSPLSALFADLAADRAGKLRDTLLAGIGSGSSSKQIARELETVGKISRARAATIARTELHRAQRIATISSYENSGVVEGWYWISARDINTCTVCWSMHGTLHPLDETFGSHPSCRCYASPALKDLRKSPDERDVRPKPKPGEDVFRQKLSAEQQKTVLGPARYEQWKNGVPLSAFVETSHDPKWGITRSIKPLSTE